MSVFFEILKTFQVITTKLRRFRLRKYYAITGAIKRNTSNLELQKGKTKVVKQGVRSLYLFEITK